MRTLIQSYADYQTFLEEDRIALARVRTLRSLLLDEVWKFQRLLRQMEYLTNCHQNLLLRELVHFRFKRQGLLLGYTIPINVFGPGLSIAHAGTIVVSGGAQVGANCRLHVCVNIGTQAGESYAAPQIGDNCYIGPGAKIFGPILIGPNVAIGANAVVNSSFPEGNATIGGIPARVISDKTSEGLLVKAHQPA
jgi:serine O-acetyltransferase